MESLPKKYQITAVLVTRGGYSIEDIVDGLKDRFEEVIVWDNSEQDNQVLYGRYKAVEKARFSTIYTQDDDCIVNNINKLIEEFDGSELIYSTTQHHKDFYKGMGIALLGWGSIFKKEWIKKLDKYIEKYGKDDLFLRECDRIFTYFVPKRSVERDIIEISRPSMSLEEGHYKKLEEVYQRLQTL